MTTSYKVLCARVSWSIIKPRMKKLTTFFFHLLGECTWYYVGRPSRTTKVHLKGKYSVKDGGNVTTPSFASTWRTPVSGCTRDCRCHGFVGGMSCHRSCHIIVLKSIVISCSGRLTTAKTHHELTISTTKKKKNLFIGALRQFLGIKWVETRLWVWQSGNVDC